VIKIWPRNRRWRYHSDTIRQFGILALAATASTSSPITQRRIGSHTGSRLCYVQGRLLQYAVGRSTFVPPAAINSLFHGFSSIRTAVAPSLSLDQRHGTCSKTISGARHANWLFSTFVVHWRRFFLISTRHTERIRGVFETMRYINWHLHLPMLIINAYLDLRRASNPVILP